MISPICPVGRQQFFNMAASSTRSFVSRLLKEEYNRYLEKISLIGGVDPYSMKKSDFCNDIDVYDTTT